MGLVLKSTNRTLHSSNFPSTVKGIFIHVISNEEVPSMNKSDITRDYFMLKGPLARKEIHKAEAHRRSGSKEPGCEYGEYDF